MWSYLLLCKFAQMTVLSRFLTVDDVNCWYWTSTEQDGAQVDRAWRFSLYSARFESADKHASFPTRPIMMIRLNKAEQQ